MIQVFARFGKLRNDVRNSAVKKVAAYYELTKPGMTPREVRHKIRALEKDQKFIYPYNPDHPFPTPAERDPVAGQPKDGDVAVSRAQEEKLAKVILPLRPRYPTLTFPSVSSSIAHSWLPS
jgi:hypothetical protein